MRVGSPKGRQEGTVDAFKRQAAQTHWSQRQGRNARKAGLPATFDLCSTQGCQAAKVLPEGEGGWPDTKATLSLR